MIEFEISWSSGGRWLSLLLNLNWELKQNESGKEKKMLWQHKLDKGPTKNINKFVDKIFLT